MPAELLFAPLRPAIHEARDSVGTQWDRLLALLDLKRAVFRRRTAIRIDLGESHGATPITPYFVRCLVERVKAEGARELFVTDRPEVVRAAASRGYTAEVLGCPIVSSTGTADLYAYPRTLSPPYRAIAQVNVAGEIADVEALIDLSHIRLGGAGFVGTTRSLALGAVDNTTRARLRALEGELEWEYEKCTQCRVCVERCSRKAIGLDDRGAWSVQHEHCRLCLQCADACPQHAIRTTGGGHTESQRGLALTAIEVLRLFESEQVVFINFLIDITASCDCWGMTKPRLLPDLGILAGRDIVALEQASLDMIRVEDLIPGALPTNVELGTTGHLFERIHGKDPYSVVNFLAERGVGSREYRVIEVR